MPAECRVPVNVDSITFVLHKTELHLSVNIQVIDVTRERYNRLSTEMSCLSDLLVDGLVDV